VGDQLVLKAPLWSFRRTFFPVARFFVDGEPIGHVRLKIARTMFGTSDARPVAERLHRQKAFLSYSSSDRTEVLKRAQGLRAAQIEVFQDVLSLDPGERCKQQIFKRIDESDIFLLFWSQAARDSKWVLKEARYALKRKKKSALGLPSSSPWYWRDRRRYRRRCGSRTYTSTIRSVISWRRHRASRPDRPSTGTHAGF
jgi:hypothetical protein